MNLGKTPNETLNMSSESQEQYKSPRVADQRAAGDAHRLKSHASASKVKVPASSLA